jgi:hypothetical protein
MTEIIKNGFHENPPQANPSEIKTQFSQRTRAAYGSIDPQLYPAYAQQEVSEQFGVTADFADGTLNPNQEARQEFWRNYDLLQNYLRSGQNAHLPIVERVRQFFIETKTQPPTVAPDLATPESYKFGFARKQLLEKPAGGLGIHLEEVQKFIGHLLLKPDKTSRFKVVAENNQVPFLTDRQALLMTHVVAPMHDLLKFLSPKEGQVMPDHEVVTAKLIRDFFVDQTVDLGLTDNATDNTAENSTHSLTARDVEFIAGVVGDHENIHKEIGRDAFATSPSAIDRAKAVFFIADTLTMALEITDLEVHLNQSELERRFIDLYQRHFDRSISKTFRPQWCLYTLKDFRATFVELEKNGLNFSAVSGVDTLISTVAQKMAENIESVLERESIAKTAGEKIYLSAEDTQQIQSVYTELTKVAQDGQKILSVEIKSEV